MNEDKTTWKDEKLKEIVEKAWKDEEFKKQLIASPKKALEDLGIFVPDNIKLRVIEEPDDKVYVLLPKKPIASPRFGAW